MVVIPKLQNTSQEFKLPIHLEVKENETLFVGNQIRQGVVPLEVLREIFHLQVLNNVTVIEDVSTNIRYSLTVVSAEETLELIADNQLPGERAVALMDVPIFQTFEGYILREGFRFTYYWIDWEGEASKLDLQR